jgi:flavin reductase (DIM6/NTAB) family NADH-FMN oxidoreductase RutF
MAAFPLFARKRMVFITRTQWEEWEKRHRADWVNRIWGYRNLSLIGTANASHATNLAPFNSLTHLGANPALAALVVRPDSAERHTLENIRSTGHFTVNAVPQHLVQKAHQAAARYPREVSEFDAVGLTPIWYEDWRAPAVAECSIQLGMQLEEEMPIARNQTILLVASLQWCRAAEEVCEGPDQPSHALAHSAVVEGLYRYAQTTPLVTLPYPKP